MVERNMAIATLGNEPALRGETALGQALPVAGGERQKALPDAWRCPGIGRATRQYKRAQAWAVYARSHCRTPPAVGFAAAVAQSDPRHRVIGSDDHCIGRGFLNRTPAYADARGPVMAWIDRSRKARAMNIVPIKNQRAYRRALKQIEGLMAAKRNTTEGDYLDVLVTLVEAWERRHYPLDLPDPVEAIKYHMDQKGLQARDLIPYIGSRNRVYEVLNRRRPLTLKMILRLHEGLGIPAESLIKVGQERAA
jgi:HTH-type transcriptional regulator/antitoxin HigA